MLLQEIREVAGGSMVLSPDDPGAERENTWWLGASPQERLGLSVDEVVGAFEETARLVRERVRDLGHRGIATFYVWHDAQAGQLRCSTASCEPGGLPFEAEYFATRDLGGIVTDFLGDGEPGFVRVDGPKLFAAALNGGPPPPVAVWTYDVSVEVTGDVA